MGRSEESKRARVDEWIRGGVGEQENDQAEKKEDIEEKRRGGEDDDEDDNEDVSLLCTQLSTSGAVHAR
jgi:hypothetical protein